MNGPGLSLVSPHLSQRKMVSTGLLSCVSFLTLLYRVPRNGFPGLRDYPSGYVAIHTTSEKPYFGTSYPFPRRGAKAISKFRGKLSEGRIINEIRCIAYHTDAVSAGL